MRCSRLACLLVVAGLASCGSGRDFGPADPGGDPKAEVDLPPSGRLFGFSSGAFAYTGREPDLDMGITSERQAADSLALGANSARVPFSWWELEPRRGRVDFGYLTLMDRFVRALEKGGGRVLFVLGGPPPWASAKPGDAAAAPRTDRYADFARFAAFVADRYPRAAGIETRNEPNSVFGWRPRPDPAAYVRLHRTAARAIRKANPATKVILGGLAGTVSDTTLIERPELYLKRMFAAGLRPSDYDALGFHPYPPQGDGTVQPLDGGRFAATFEDFRRGYRERDPDAEVWITETGLTTTGPDAVSPSEQAEELPPLVRKLLTMPRVKAVYVHTLYDLTRRPAGNPQRGFGLLVPRSAARGTPKPAFCALRRLVSLAPAYPGCK